MLKLCASGGRHGFPERGALDDQCTRLTTLAAGLPAEVQQHTDINPASAWAHQSTP
jgi:hypothetical protein